MILFKNFFDKNMQEGEETKAQPPPQELTIDMIKPTEDNEIPPNGIFPGEDDMLRERWQAFRKKPSNVTARLAYLDYVRIRGDFVKVIKYLETVKNQRRETYIPEMGAPVDVIEYLKKLKQLPDLYKLSPEMKLRETQMLAEALMNAAEAERRRDEHWRKPRGLGPAIAPTGEREAIRLLRMSLEYKKEADELRQQLQSQAQQNNKSSK